MTKEENEVVELLADAWNKFVDLPVLHKADREEFMHALHQAQNIVMARQSKHNG